MLTISIAYAERWNICLYVERVYAAVTFSVRQMFIFSIKAVWSFEITYSNLTYCHNRHPQKIPTPQKQQASLTNSFPQRRCSPLKEFYSLQELIIERKNDNLLNNFLKSKVFVWYFNNNFGIFKIQNFLNFLHTQMDFLNIPYF